MNWRNSAAGLATKYLSAEQFAKSGNAGSNLQGFWHYDGAVFAEDHLIELTPEQRLLFDKWATLTEKSESSHLTNHQDLRIRASALIFVSKITHYKVIYTTNFSMIVRSNQEVFTT